MSGITSVSQLGAQVPGVRETPMERLAQQEKTGAVAGAERVEDKSALEQKEKSSAPIVDEYVHGEKPLPTGLYRLAKDGEGKQKIVFDDPSKPNDEQAEAADSKPASPVKQSSADEKAADEPAKADEDKKAEEKCTTNTDKVDAEIKKLKERKEKLEQQLQQAADNPDKQEKLQRQLQQTEREISMKDNDSYRRQHAEYTSGE